MPYYFIANIKIEDEKEYNNYLTEVDEVFAKHNGKYLAVDDNPTLLEGKWDYSRSIIIEFESECDFKEWYYSDDYQRIFKHRLTAAVCDTILVKGKN